VRAILPLVAVVVALAGGPAFAGAGQDLFNANCADCHTLDSASDSAPSLKGVVGRRIASLSNFQYSDALKAKAGQVWTDATLNAFLAAPQSFAKGTSMFGGAPDPTQRQAIIDYLKTVK
jgi:cytochrome c